MARSCGDCSLCCYVPSIEVLNKPINTWCTNCSKGEAGSCKIYNDRPKPCIDFRCLWLQAGDPKNLEGSLNKFYSLDLRPDKVGAYIDVTESGDILIIRVKKFKYFNKLKKKFRDLCYTIGSNVPLMLVDGDGSYSGIGLAVVKYFKDGGYNMDNILTASMGRNKFDLETEQGKKDFYEHIEKAKIKNVK